MFPLASKCPDFMSLLTVKSLEASDVNCRCGFKTIIILENISHSILYHRCRMERDSVNVSLFCNVLVEQNISSLHKLVPNPMLKNVFDFVEHLKSSHRLSRVPRRSLPVAVKVTNNFGQDIFDISVFFDLSIELNAKERDIN